MRVLKAQPRVASIAIHRTGTNTRLYDQRAQAIADLEDLRSFSGVAMAEDHICI